MALDGLVLTGIVTDLSHRITGGRIEKIYQPEADEIICLIHSGKVTWKLYLSSNSSHPRVQLLDETGVMPQNPMSFCMLLRKHLQGGRIRSVEQKESERVMILKVDAVSEMGYSVSKHLYIEIMGKHSNLILVDGATGKIIDSIKRVSVDVSRSRQVLPGLAYADPPAQDKVPYFNLTLDQLQSVLENSKDPARSLVSGIMGISPLLAEEILHRSQDPVTQAASPNAIFTVLTRLVSEASQGKLQPVVYLDQEGHPVDYHVIQIQSLEEVCQMVPFDSIHAAMSYYYTSKESSNRNRQKSADLFRTIQSAIEKAGLKKQRLLEDLKEASNLEQLQLFGELLLANLHQIKRGDAEVRVWNYYDGIEIKISLDPLLTPSQNAQKYYKRYAKAKTALIEKSAQLKETDLDLTYLDSVVTYLEQAADVRVIEEIRMELMENGYLKKRKNQYQPSKQRSTPHAYQTSDGFKLLVGRNNKENDQLTFHMASGKDLWFHAKDIPGSHVVLFSGGKPVSDQALVEAAQIAAWHSKGRSGDRVQVDYTPVRNVKKPTGAKPGMVIFTGNKTLTVDPLLPTTE